MPLFRGLLSVMFSINHTCYSGQGWDNFRFLSLLHFAYRFSLPCFFFGICISNAQHVDTYKRNAHEVGTARLVGVGNGMSIHMVICLLLDGVCLW